MKVTLDIADSVIWQVQAEAARQGRTMSEMVEAVLARSVGKLEANFELPPLPELDGGGMTVDVADRNALCGVKVGHIGAHTTKQ
jgi:hypothetical protein